MRVIKAKSLKGLLDTVKDLNKDNKYWFRGHADSSYVLLPSAYRKLIVVQDQFGRPVEPREILPTDTHGDVVLLPDNLYLNSFFSELDRQKIDYEKNLNIVEKYCLANITVYGLHCWIGRRIFLYAVFSHVMGRRKVFQVIYI